MFRTEEEIADVVKMQTSLLWRNREAERSGRKTPMSEETMRTFLEMGMDLDGPYLEDIPGMRD
jgi:hypothetical protein